MLTRLRCVTGSPGRRSLRWTYHSAAKQWSGIEPAFDQCGGLPQPEAAEEKNGHTHHLGYGKAKPCHRVVAKELGRRTGKGHKGRDRRRVADGDTFPRPAAQEGAATVLPNTHLVELGWVNRQGHGIAFGAPANL